MNFSNRLLLTLLTVSATFTIGGTAYAWDPVRDLTGRTIKQHVERGADRTVNTAGKILNDPIGYAVDLPEKIFTQICAVPAQAFGVNMARQADGRWLPLPPLLISDVQQYYSTDLRTVLYADNISTGGPEGATFGKLIYLSRPVNFNRPADLWLILHELEHTEHYRNETRAAKLCEYSLKAVGNGFDHDRIDWERAADRKADFVMTRLGYNVRAAEAPMTPSLASNQTYFRNDSNTTITFGVQIPGHQWAEYTLPSGQVTVVTSDDPANHVFNIAAITNGRQVGYEVPGGTGQSLQYNNHGLVDFFRMW